MSASKKPRTIHTYGYPLVGFAGTGKDSLVRDIKSQSLALASVDNYPDCKWEVWSSVETAQQTNLRDLEALFDPENSEKVTRFAFADKLKDETHRYLGLVNVATDSFENTKTSCL